MVIGGGKAGNIKQANPTRASQAFLVAWAGQFDRASIGSFPSTIRASGQAGVVRPI
jgi:hypothetical protein